MKPRIYLETSIISYLSARPSRDSVAAEKQKITREWWNQYSNSWDIFVSDIVYQEISKGDPLAVKKRIELIHNLKLLKFTDECERLTKKIIFYGILPSKTSGDAAHIVIATLNNMDYLLSWNCRHLVNLTIWKRVDKLLKTEGLTTPIVVTPQFFQGGLS